MNLASRVDMVLRLCFRDCHEIAPLLAREHKASLGFAVQVVIGPIIIRVSYKTIADVDVDANANANANANADAKANANADSDADANSNANGNAKADSDAGANAIAGEV